MTAEISSSSQEEMLSEAAKYFKMKYQAILANDLMQYVSTASQPLSILLGIATHCSYLLAYYT